MAMQKINVRFSDETKAEIALFAESHDLFDSYVSRAAINIGMKELFKCSNSKAGSADLYKLIEDNQ
jgi:hypothetical protein